MVMLSRKTKPGLRGISVPSSNTINSSLIVSASDGLKSAVNPVAGSDAIGVPAGYESLIQFAALPGVCTAAAHPRKMTPRSQDPSETITSQRGAPAPHQPSVRCSHDNPTSAESGCPSRPVTFATPAAQVSVVVIFWQ